MQYKTIVLELLRERKELHEQLRLTRRLLPTMESLARDLKARHDHWRETLATQESDPIRISSEAMEMALAELEDRLPSVHPQPDEEALSLDQAMAFVLSHSSRK